MVEQVVCNLLCIEDFGLVVVDLVWIFMVEVEFIFFGGNGVQDWMLFYQVVVVFGVIEGVLWVVVDDGYMLCNCQVGVIGIWVIVWVYLVVGIFGVIQYLQGIGVCDKVVVVNCDVGCDMIKCVDFLVIGDLMEIFCVLICLVEVYCNGVVCDVV